MNEKVTLVALHQMKRDGRKIVGVVLYDYQMAQLADRAAVDIVSVGDSVGVNMWGHAGESEVTIDQIALVCAAVRRGVTRALVSCDVPFAPLQAGLDTAVAAAKRLVAEGADLVKIDVGASSVDTVRAVVRAGIRVWAQFGTEPAASITDQLVREAKRLEDAGASLLDFRYSGPVAGPEVVRSVNIPVIGGLGGGPWLDGRVRALVPALGCLASAVDDPVDRYANVALTMLNAIEALRDDVRAGRPLRGAAPAAKS